MKQRFGFLELRCRCRLRANRFCPWHRSTWTAAVCFTSAATAASRTSRLSRQTAAFGPSSRRRLRICGRTLRCACVFLGSTLASGHLSIMARVRQLDLCAAPTRLPVCRPLTPQIDLLVISACDSLACGAAAVEAGVPHVIVTTARVRLCGAGVLWRCAARSACC
jgi:hypothetical protein